MRYEIAILFHHETFSEPILHSTYRIYIHMYILPNNQIYLARRTTTTPTTTPNSQQTLHHRVAIPSSMSSGTLPHQIYHRAQSLGEGTYGSVMVSKFQLNMVHIDNLGVSC